MIMPGDRADGPSARTARHSPEDESSDRWCTGYWSMMTLTRRINPHDRDASPVR